MSYDGWIEYGGVELVNLARTAALAVALNVNTVRLRTSDFDWMKDALGDGAVNYGDVTLTPWYDAGYPASSEFIGVIPLTMQGMDDSTLQANPVEYITDGGNNGRARNATLPIVASVVIAASTDRGAEFGKRWLDKVLRGSDTGSSRFCSGADLTYFRERGSDTITPEKAHRRNVSTTRGTSVTRKRSDACSATWALTYTWNCGDPYEYGDELAQVNTLGGVVAGPGLKNSGTVVLVNESCPVYDYSPIYDPLYPALVPAPSVPDLTPDGWTIADGQTFERFWALLNTVEPSGLNMVPVITLTSTEDARMVRVSIFDNSAGANDQCDALFTCVVSYMPANMQFVIDGEQQAAYVWDGVSPNVRRTDSLVYAGDGGPVQWAAFNDPAHMMVVLDIFADSDGYEGDGNVRAALALVPKSD